MDERMNLEDASAEMLEALDLTEKAHMLIQQDDYDEAEKLLSRAEKIEPMCSRIYLERGGILVLKADYYGAIDQYKRCLLINKEDPETHYMMGNTYLLMDDFDEAVISYSKADKAGYREMYLLNNQGYCYERKGEYDAAVRCYQRAMDAYPQWSDPYMRRIGCLMAMRKVEEAEEAGRDAVRRFPDVPKSWEELGRTLMAQFKAEEADTLLRDAAKRFPDNIQIRLLLLDNCITMGKDEEAEEIDEEIRDIENIPPEVLTHLDKVKADAYFRADKIDKAIECYERCVERDTPEEPDTQARMALMTMYRHTGELKKLQSIAADSLKTSRADDELCSAYVMEAIAVDEMGHKEEAAILYREAIRRLTMIAIKQRARTDTHVYRVMCYLGLREFAKAYDELDYVEKATGVNPGTQELRVQILRAEGKDAEADALEAQAKAELDDLRKGLQDV